MRTRTWLILFICIAFIWIQCSSEKTGTTYQLYYLGGQSNMDGYGLVGELPEDLNIPVKGVRIFHGNPAPDGGETDGRGLWTELVPGHGAGFQSDGDTNTYTERFGIELTFTKKLLELNPDSKIALIKYSRGGTSLAIEAAAHFGCWNPDYHSDTGINQYDHFLATVRNAMDIKDIDGDGKVDKLIPRGILWMQGESDANHTKIVAGRYEGNLKRLMDLIRAVFRIDDLPVVIGRISDSGQAKDGKVWDYGYIVRKAQEEFVRKDAKAALVTSTDDYSYSDPWHYDTKGFLDLGEKFAEAMVEIQTDSRN
ncbi:sialate O-acetylesterase [bacterium]